VLDGDVVAGEPRGLGAAVRDQRLGRRQFQLEVLAQELGQALFDLLGFGLRAGEPEQVIVGLCRLRDYADRLVHVLVRALSSGAGAA